ncbi:MAG: glutathione peroxidase [Candidatus Krumholzibacteriia bacterium]
MAGGEQTAPDQVGSLWTLETRTLEGDPAPLADWQGQVVLVVNVASKCGLTPQYEGLEKLYRARRDEGFAILGFPSNDFMGQEPGSPAEIRQFCTTKFDVTFPLLAKVAVKGDGKDPVYGWLTAGGLEEPTWNFTKYLVGRDGKVIARFGPAPSPAHAPA